MTRRPNVAGSGIHFPRLCGKREAPYGRVVCRLVYEHEGPHELADIGCVYEIRVNSGIADERRVCGKRPSYLVNGEVMCAAHARQRQGSDAPSAPTRGRALGSPGPRTRLYLIQIHLLPEQERILAEHGDVYRRLPTGNPAAQRDAMGRYLYTLLHRDVEAIIIDAQEQALRERATELL